MTKVKPTPAPKLPTDPGPAQINAALDPALGGDMVKQSIDRQRKVIADMIDLQKQFPRDSASWRHVEDMMGDLLSSIDLLAH